MDLLHVYERLARHRIPIETWGRGKAKTMDALKTELDEGECVLVERGDKLIRILRPVLIEVSALEPIDGEGVVLVEVERRYSDGRDASRRLSASLGEKRIHHEDPVVAAARALREELGVIVSDSRQTLVLSRFELKMEESWSFPGLWTELRIHRFEYGMPPEHYQEEYVELQADKRTVFRWRDFKDRPWE